MDALPHLTFESVFTRWPWCPIPDCPGRYVLRGVVPTLTPCDVLGQPLDVLEFHVPTTPDTVLVVQFTAGGLLSFRKPDGQRYVHTLNTSEGLVRRLGKLGLRI